MSYKIGKTFVIQPEAARKCELCGAVEECRPYGPNGEQICFACGEKDPETTARKIAERFDGPSEVTPGLN